MIPAAPVSYSGLATDHERMAKPTSDTLIRDPIYKQLNDALRSLITSGEFKIGAKFLSEREIGERFSVSRATANKALSTLVAEGVLEFRKGVGTFVQSKLLDYDLRALVSFTDSARAAGKVPSTRVLAAKMLSASDVDAELTSKLGRSSPEPVYYLERLRMADAQPLIVERRYVVARFCPGLLDRDLEGSLYTSFTEHYGLEISGAEQSIRAVAADEADARLLAIETGTACLLVGCRGLLSSAEALWWEQTLYRGDAYEFRTEVGPIQSRAPLEWAFIDPELAAERRRKQRKRA